jgi:hypothetical protein
MGGATAFCLFEAASNREINGLQVLNPRTQLSQPHLNHHHRRDGHDGRCRPAEQAEQPKVDVLAHDLPVTGQQYDQRHQRWGEDAVDNG